MTENWKDIPSWEGVYAVSNFGRVKRLAGSERCLTDRILKPMQNQRGYLTVAPVSFGKKQTPMVIHRLVLHAFVGPAPEGYYANHINGNKTDNRLCNLEWVTPAENIKHAYDMGLHKRYVGSASSSAKLTEEQVADILQRIANREYRKDIAELYGIGTRTVDQIVSGENWKHVPRPDMSGKRIGRRKLVEADIPKVRAMIAQGLVCRVIGEQFGVSTGAIQAIKEGRAWGHVS